MPQNSGTQRLPKSEADPVPPPLQPPTGELRDEHLQIDQTEGDEGGGHSNLSNVERLRRRPKKKKRTEH